MQGTATVATANGTPATPNCVLSEWQTVVVVVVVVVTTTEVDVGAVVTTGVVIVKVIDVVAVVLVAPSPAPAPRIVVEPTATPADSVTLLEATMPIPTDRSLSELGVAAVVMLTAGVELTADVVLLAVLTEISASINVVELDPIPADRTRSLLVAPAPTSIEIPP